MIERMMQQMLSKEYLYQPMKDITASYPPWIAAHAASLSAGEVEQYRAQQRCFERIVAVYEREGGGGGGEGKEVMDIMAEMQRYGQPPKELVHDMLPPGMMGEGGGEVGAGAGGGGGAGGMEALDRGMMEELGKNGCPTQ